MREEKGNPNKAPSSQCHIEGWDPEMTHRPQGPFEHMQTERHFQSTEREHSLHFFPAALAFQNTHLVCDIILTSKMRKPPICGIF